MLRLPKVMAEEIIAHCQARYPKEACGLLAGAEGRVAQVYPMTNVEDSPIGYAMDPKEQLRVEKQMRANGQRMVGIYHSHTASEASPSSVDVRLAISPEFSYVLVSLQDRQQPVLKSYRIDGTTVIPEEVFQVQ
ncbi:MAG: M67 family metallopeptidase [Candidatus Omnitrophica bacterium]|nr:M67 family metallopeptidase [Candidatus Omnitrophota bacterium]